MPWQQPNFEVGRPLLAVFLSGKSARLTANCTTSYSFRGVFGGGTSSGHFSGADVYGGYNPGGSGMFAGSSRQTWQDDPDSWRFPPQHGQYGSGQGSGRQPPQQWLDESLPGRNRQC